MHLNMITFLTAAASAIFATSATAFECTFVTECMETEACAEASFSLASNDTGGFSTDFGDLEVVIDQTQDTTRSVFATSPGMQYLLTVVGTDARLATHMTDPAMAINYAGTCTNKP